MAYDFFSQINYSYLTKFIMNKTIFRCRVLISTVAGVLLTVSVHAETTALLSFNSSDPTNNTSTVAGTTTAGWGFTARANLSVTSLGFLHTYPNDPLAVTHQVAIWDSHSNMLVQATIALPTVGSPLNSFNYVSVAPTALAMGETYYIGAQMEAIDISNPDTYMLKDGRYWFNVTDSVFSPEIGNVFPARSDWDVGFVFPAVINTGGEGRYGPNFTYEVTSVPEPSTAALLLGSLAVTVGLWKRNRSSREGVGS